MKQLYTATLIALCSYAVSAQNFQLFNATSKKVFTTSPVAGQTFNLAFEEVTSNGDNSVFHPFLGLEDYEIVMGESCMTPSSSGFCMPETRPSWVGSAVNVINSTQAYTFETVSGFQIPVNFNVQGNNLFFQDENQKFYFNRQADSYENILGLSDSVKNLEIIHTDLNGNIINSELNGYVIKTGKVLGLINFFRIDSFPQILQPVALSGNSEPVAGLTQITNEDLYDLHAGDIVQFHEKSMKFTCHAEVLYDRYVKLTYLERIDTPDSIIFICHREMFLKDSLKTEVDTVRHAYDRNLVVASLPFDYSSHDNPLYRKTLRMDDYCGEPKWTFMNTYLHMVYCEETDCWTYQDVPGIPIELSETVVWGIGRYSYHIAESINYETFVYDYNINYFSKGGTVCGQEMIVSSDYISLSGKKLVVSPNPAKETITLGGFNKGNITIIGLDGKIVKEVKAHVAGQKLQVDDLNKGIYILKIATDSEVLSTKIIRN